jgi:3-oxoacyl-[acyl-carrier protein] reductase
MANAIDLAGRGAVVTGGASGIGLAVARRLIESGARVALWDRDADTLAAAARELGHGIYQAVDLRDVDAVAEAAFAAIDALGEVGVLVTSGGIAGLDASAWEYPLEEWQDVLDVNLTATFLCVRAFVPHMRERDYGRIVTIASLAAKSEAANAAAYSASKAGVIALTKALGKELAGTNVRANCVTTSGARSSRPRPNTAGEIAALVAWLCSEDCSYSTGGVFDLSGGRAV